MIKITKAKESRKRDKKRNRQLLQIGKYKFHLTEQEARELVKMLMNSWFYGI